MIAVVLADREAGQMIASATSQIRPIIAATWSPALAFGSPAVRRARACMKLVRRPACSTQAPAPIR